VSGGSGSHTYYLPGNIEEVTPSGSLVKYYNAGGLSLGENTATSASGIAYLASDGLGSVTEALNPTGTATGSILYGPYGGVRYSTGTMPTSKGFTGQYADAATGLDYYGARYYDPALGQFASADTVLQGGGYSICGLNRYGYVKGNPETLSDPSGNCPQKPQGWRAKLQAWGVAFGIFLLQLPSNGITPYDEAVKSHGPSSPTEIVQQTENKNARSAENSTGSGNGCDDDDRINTDEGTPAIEVERAGRTIATVSRSGETVRWNRAARRHPQWVKGEQMSNAQALQVNHAWTAHLEAVNSAAFGPQSAYIPSLRDPIPAGVPLNIWIHEVLNPFTIGLTVGGAALQYLANHLSSSHNSVNTGSDEYNPYGGGGGVYDQAGVSSVGGGGGEYRGGEDRVK
jgi:RHS repeat-associated protein